MNRFTKPSLRKRLLNRIPVALISFALIMILFLYGVSKVSQSSVLNERTLLENALQRDISHCYAVEGTYPPSLEYMKEHYGLTYDENQFLINYEYVGSNILPTFYILER